MSDFGTRSRVDRRRETQAERCGGLGAKPRYRTAAGIILQGGSREHEVAGLAASTRRTSTRCMAEDERRVFVVALGQPREASGGLRDLQDVSGGATRARLNCK